MGDFWSSVQDLTFENEGDVETRLVLPLLRALGYNDSDIGAKVPIVFQQGKKGRRHEADFVVYDGPVRNTKTSLLVLEAKGPNESLSTGTNQGESTRSIRGRHSWCSQMGLILRFGSFSQHKRVNAFCKLKSRAC